MYIISFLSFVIKWKTHLHHLFFFLSRDQSLFSVAQWRTTKSISVKGTFEAKECLCHREFFIFLQRNIQPVKDIPRLRKDEACHDDDEDEGSVLRFQHFLL